VAFHLTGAIAGGGVLLRAIVFDFFGTLTDPTRESGRRTAYNATARVIGIPGEKFWQAVTDSYTERATGVLGGTTETLTELARRCGFEPSAQTIADAARTHYEGARYVQGPRSGVLEVLATLRKRGFALGLLSDCSSELCEMWTETPYAPFIDATTFSWAEGYRKPDLRGFLTAAARLGVDPSQCWFVGDGGSREMSGAQRAGMRPVLVTNEKYADHAQYRDDPDAFIPADVIADITDLTDLVSTVAVVEP
jgi:putative hydrolase of the HAD superfamily